MKQHEAIYAAIEKGDGEAAAAAASLHLDYVRERLQGRDDLRRNRIFITHSGCAPEIVENVKAIIKECGGFDEVLETYAGCTVSSHCGPNTLGVLFVRK